MGSRFALGAAAALSLSLASFACDADDAPARPDAGKAGAAGAALAEPTPPAADRPPEPFVAAAAQPPPAPEGTRAVKVKEWLYVQTCEERFPCVTLEQARGEAHCRELTAAARPGWRLPSRDEAEAFAGVDGLERLAGYHWTRSPYEEDAAQVWIVDPVGGQPTTLPRDRKALLVRCVTEA